MERFIESLSELLEAFPSATVSVTYSNSAKKTKKEDPKRAHNVVKFKCYEPHLGKCVKYSTYKLKELSRLLIFLGPRGVSSLRKPEESEEPAAKRRKTDITGVASLMSNTKFEEQPEPEVVPEAKAQAVALDLKENSPQPAAASKSKKKKKGKKK